MDLRSNLSKVKGHGVSGDGAKHWLLQRFTAVLLIFLVAWFVTFLVSAVSNNSSALIFLGNPVNAVLLTLFIITALYHGCLGMKVVIEDYIHCKCVKLLSILIINFVSIVLAISSFYAVFNMHINLYGTYLKGAELPYLGNKQKRGCHHDKQRKGQSRPKGPTGPKSDSDETSL